MEVLPNSKVATHLWNIPQATFTNRRHFRDSWMIIGVAGDCLTGCNFLGQTFLPKKIIQKAKVFSNISPDPFGCFFPIDSGPGSLIPSGPRKSPVYFSSYFTPLLSGEWKKTPVKLPVYFGYGFFWVGPIISLQIYTHLKFNSSPLKSYRNPIGKADRLPFPSFFRGKLLLSFGNCDHRQPGPTLWRCISF